MLTVKDTLLLVMDIQERLFPQMYEKETFLRNVQMIIKGALTFHLPVLVTEQAPQKIGRTIPEIFTLLSGVKIFEKFSFSGCGNPDLLKKLKSLKRKDILIAGVEAHVCVYQSVCDLVRLGFDAYAVVDAVSSRTQFNKEIGLENIKRAGGHWTSVETVLCELLKEARGEQFKAILKLIK